MAENNRNLGVEENRLKHFVFHNLSVFHSVDKEELDDHISAENHVRIVSSTSEEEALKINDHISREWDYLGADFVVKGSDVRLETNSVHTRLEFAVDKLHDYQVISDHVVICDTKEDFEKYLDCADDIHHIYASRTPR